LKNCKFHFKKCKSGGDNLQVTTVTYKVAPMNTIFEIAPFAEHAKHDVVCRVTASQ